MRCAFNRICCTFHDRTSRAVTKPNDLEGNRYLTDRLHTISCSCLYFKSDSNISLELLRILHCAVNCEPARANVEPSVNLLLSTKFMLINCHILSDMADFMFMHLENITNRHFENFVLFVFRKGKNGGRVIFWAINKLTASDHLSFAYKLCDFLCADTDHIALMFSALRAGTKMPILIKNRHCH